MTAHFISQEQPTLSEFRCHGTKEARKDDILTIANLAMRSLRLDSRKRPTMKEVSAEIKAPRKIQSSLHIKDESPSDGQSFEHSTTDIFHEFTVETFSLSSQMESTYF